jgi:gamma-glutamyltranspeptidase / glutathione hydrolase
VTAELWHRSRDFLAGDPHAATTFLVGGRTPAAGETFRNPDLARTLERIAGLGRDGFYGGETAAAMVAVSGARGGTLSRPIWPSSTPEWVEPITTEYRGWTVYETPPQSQGIAALVMLDLMHHFPMGDLGFHSPDALHVMIEAKKLAYADLIARVGRPALRHRSRRGHAGPGGARPTGPGPSTWSRAACDVRPRPSRA